MRNLWLIGLLFVCLLLLLSGCASCPTPVKTEPLTKDHLRIRTPVPECRTEDNGDLLECLAAMRKALDAANADKAVR